MKKKIRELNNRFWNKMPKWINLQNVVFIIVIVAFFIIVLWSESISYFFKDKQSENAISKATPTILPEILTSLPEEWIRSADQTSGVILGAIIIILTVVAGTVVILVRDRE